MPRISTCPKCGSDAVKRTHRQGAAERIKSLFLLYPYRCRKCEHRFMRVRTASSTDRGSGHKILPKSKRRREILLYGIGVLFFLALLSFIVRERESSSDGN